MKKKLVVIVPAALILAAALVFFFVLRPRGGSFAGLRKGRDFNVILLTIDTLRADRLGCYGFQAIETPAIDGLAERGVRFERCIAQTPLTLPSHTSILTGTYPLFHGVRDNGGFIVPPDLETLAEVFKNKGYQTGAFVAAYVLDSRWGLNQGFDYYFDKFDLSRFEMISLGSVQRPGNEVMDEALPWLAQHKGKKFFVWIHLYDPHTPYEPPSPYKEKYPDRPYLGEIAFADSQVARLLSFLESNQLLDTSFLVMAGDHGESLGQHKETTHGFFVYQEAVHVPLIFVTPFSELQGVVSSHVTNLADIMPTVLDMAGFPVPSEVQGSSLASEFFEPEKGTTGLAYSETFYPRFHFGWSELQSVQDARFKLILAPQMELYDLEQDPRELTNLINARQDVAKDLKDRADALIARLSTNAHSMDVSKLDEETREKLAALGYIGSFTDSSKLAGKTLASPRHKIDIFNQLTAARELGMTQDAEKGIGLIQGIIAQDPNIVDAYFTLGNIYFRLRKFPEAMENFRRSLEMKPDDTFTVINIANCYTAQRQFEEAERFVLDYLKTGLQDSQLYFLLGKINLAQRKFDQAIPFYEKCLTVNSESASAHNALAAIYYLKDDLERAERHAREALRFNDRLSSAHYNLAQILEKRELLAEAEAEYIKELEYTPSHFKACFNLARLYRVAGDVEGERKCLERGLVLEPDFPLTYFYLARLNLNSGEEYEEAVALVEKGLTLKPRGKDLALGYFLLADLYNRMGDTARSDKYARLGQDAAGQASAQDDED